jgi:hypothetical protein
MGNGLAKLRPVSEEQLLHLDIETSLEGIRQGYILGFETLGLKRIDLATALKEIKAALRKHHEARLPAEGTFESGGLSVFILGESSRPRSYVGTAPSPEYVFRREYMERIQRRIDKAAGQLPKGEAGIVIIDASMATFMGLYDIQDACYGEEVGTIRDGMLINARLPDGVFARRNMTRVSAVAFYEHNLGN